MVVKTICSSKTYCFIFCFFLLIVVSLLSRHQLVVDLVVNNTLFENEIIEQEQVFFHHASTSESFQSYLNLLTNSLKSGIANEIEGLFSMDSTAVGLSSSCVVNESTIGLSIRRRGNLHIPCLLHHNLFRPEGKPPASNILSSPRHCFVPPIDHPGRI